MTNANTSQHAEIVRRFAAMRMGEVGPRFVWAHCEVTSALGRGLQPMLSYDDWIAVAALVGLA